MEELVWGYYRRSNQGTQSRHFLSALAARLSARSSCISGHQHQSDVETWRTNKSHQRIILLFVKVKVGWLLVGVRIIILIHALFVNANEMVRACLCGSVKDAKPGSSYLYYKHA